MHLYIYIDISILQPGQQAFMSPRGDAQSSPNNNMRQLNINASSGSED